MGILSLIKKVIAVIFFKKRISERGCRKAMKHKPFSSSKKAVMIKYVKEHAQRERFWMHVISGST